MGRKKSQNPRTYGYRIRLTKEEHDALIEISKMRKTTVSKLFRDFIQEQFDLLNGDRA